MAYFAFLSLFQVVVLGVIVFSLLVGEGEARHLVIGRIERALPLEPGTVGAIVESIIESRGGVTIVSVAILAWGAIGFFGALSTGVGRAFATTTRRPFWQDKLIGLLLLGGAGVLTLGSIGIGWRRGSPRLNRIRRRPERRAARRLVGCSSRSLVLVAAGHLPVVPNRTVTFRQVLPGRSWPLCCSRPPRRIHGTPTDIARYEASSARSRPSSRCRLLHLASMVTLLGAGARANVLEDDGRWTKKVDS
jgi:uncharacterized BrkB/YihY/UPF0761 family membrane protein